MRTITYKKSFLDDTLKRVFVKNAESNDDNNITASMSNDIERATKSICVVFDHFLNDRFLQLLLGSTVPKYLIVPQIDEEKYKVGLELIDILESIAQTVPEKHEKTEPKGADTLTEYWDEISQLAEAERAQWTKSRVGQNKLRSFLLKIHGGCQITGINRKELLIASHIKPWRDCADKKREGLDPENILLLAKNYDAFFDAALISFSPNDGSLIVSPLVTESDLDLMGIRRDAKLSSPSFKQAEYLKWHNELLRKRKN